MLQAHRKYTFNTVSEHGYKNGFLNFIPKGGEIWDDILYRKPKLLEPDVWNLSYELQKIYEIGFESAWKTDSILRERKLVVKLFLE